MELKQEMETRSEELAKEYRILLEVEMWEEEFRKLIGKISVEKLKSYI